MHGPSINLQQKQTSCLSRVLVELPQIKKYISVSPTCLPLTFSLPHTYPLPLRPSKSFNIFHHMGVSPCHPLFLLTRVCLGRVAAHILSVHVGWSLVTSRRTQTRASVSTDPGELGGSGYDTRLGPRTSHQP